MRFALFYGFLFSSDANFFRKATNGRPYFLIVRFVRVRSAWFYICGLSSFTPGVWPATGLQRWA